MKKIAVMHHDDNDGYFAAAIVAGAVDFDEVKYYPVNYKNNGWFYEVIKEDFDHLYMLDFTAKPEQMESTMNIYEGEFTHIDHHPRAEKYKKCIWDDRKSATLLTFEYFYPEKQPGLCIEMIDNYDLWKKDDCWRSTLCFNLGYSLYRNGGKFRALYLPKNDEAAYDVFCNTGDSIYCDRKQYFDNKKIELPTGDIANYLFEWWHAKTAIITTHYLTSAFCEDRLKEEGYQIVILSDVRYDEKKGCYLRKNSIRSLDEEVKVNDLAEAFGGGGHPMAAGFWTDINFYKLQER